MGASSSKYSPRRAKPSEAALLAALSAAAFCALPLEGQIRMEIDLRSDLVLGDASGTMFGDVLRLAVNSKGTIYVGDWMNTNVLVFSSKGALLDTIGRRGQGPGEFTAVHDVVASRGDSVYVYDANTMRLAVFNARGTSHALAYSVRPQPSEFGRPYRILIPNDARAKHLFAFRQAASGTVSVHQVDHEGAVNDRPILRGAAAESKANIRQADGSTEVVRTSPLFGRAVVLGLTVADEVYYGWTETIDLTFFDLTGRQTSIFRADSPPIPVTARDIEFVLEGSSEARRRALSGATHARTKPALHTVIIDDESRIWTGRFTRDPERHEWWVTLDHGRGESAILSLPSTVELQVVRNGYAYAVSVDDAGAPTVIRYRVTIRNKGAR